MGWLEAFGEVGGLGAALSDMAESAAQFTEPWWHILTRADVVTWPECSP